MNYLQYKSNEMFSSTNLIRKSKSIFDKLQNNEIEKAVILRDGKPSFIMIEFEHYERIMNEYQKLKELELTLYKNISTEEEIIQDKKEIKLEEEDRSSENLHKKNKINKTDLLNKLDSIDGIINNDTEEKNDKLKEFWE